jgi:uncharacterized protein with HEPN domain
MRKLERLRVIDYLGHIVDAIDRIYRYVDGMTELAFLDDEKTQDAVVRNFEVLGEAAHNIEQFHAAFATAHSQVPWRLMYTMRNRVSHAYFNVDFGLVWRTIGADLPELRNLVSVLLLKTSAAD